MFKHIVSTVLILVMCAGLLAMTGIGVSAKHPFTDVPEWAESYVEDVYKIGIMQGTGADKFGSDGILTREQLVVTLYRLSGSRIKGTAESLSKSFADAADISTWAYDAVEWAYREGITSGIAQGDSLIFKPKNNVTRQEAAKFFVTYIDYMDLAAPTDNKADIKDIDTVDAWALPYVERCIAAGIINGDGNGNFNPRGNTVRIAAAKMLACLPIRRNVKMIAHMGYHEECMSNTVEAFIAAGERSYYGIESDVRITADGQFVMFHDASITDAEGNTYVIRETKLEDIKDIRLLDNGVATEYKLPLLEDYIKVCKDYGKTPILELKDTHTTEELELLISAIDSVGYLAETVFISFSWDNCVRVRELLPDNTVMYLTEENFKESLIDQLVEYNIDLNINRKCFYKPHVEKLHLNGIKVATFTCDDAKETEKLISWGVDFVTTNVLE